MDEINESIAGILGWAPISVGLNEADCGEGDHWTWIEPNGQKHLRLPNWSGSRDLMCELLAGLSMREWDYYLEALEEIAAPQNIWKDCTLSDMRPLVMATADQQASAWLKAKARETMEMNQVDLEMTLMKFRQLPIIDVYKKDGRPIDGEFLGVVRYEVDNRTTWVVVNVGGMLSRGMTVKLYVIDYIESELRHIANAWKQQLVYDQWCARHPWKALFIQRPSCPRWKMWVERPSCPNWDQLYWFDLDHDRTPTPDQVRALQEEWQARIPSAQQAKNTESFFHALPQLFIIG